MPAAPEVSFELVNSPAALGRLCSLLDSLGEQDCVAADTEFEREVTYYPRLALLQLSAAGHTWLVDPLGADLSPLAGALCRTRACVLLFSAAEDLELLAELADGAGLGRILPGRCCDLQQLEAFAGTGYSRSLQTSLREALGIELQKSETRSDWMQRPLSPAQLEYAAQDTAYLKPLYENCLGRFRPGDPRLEWFWDQMEQLKRSATEVQDPQLAYLHVSGAGVLDRAALTRLRLLCARRLEFAREHNVALNRVITSAALCSLAVELPATPKGLAGCRMKWGAIREYGDMILGWIKEARELPEDPGMMEALDAFSNRRETRGALRALRHLLREKAAEAGICPELLSSRRSLHEYFHALHYGRVPLLGRGWQQRCAGSIDPQTLYARSRTAAPEHAGD